MTCTADGCDRGHVARGFCDRHYRQHRRQTEPAFRDREKKTGREREQRRRRRPEARARHAQHERRRRAKPEVRARILAQRKDYYRTYREIMKTKQRERMQRDFKWLPGEDREVLYERQGGLCAVCGQPDARRELSVDHCHETGYVRGLLCSTCNLGLGMLGDDLLGLRRVVAYLEAAEARRP